MIKALTQILQKRIDNLTVWLKLNGENCSVEQLHLDKDSKERIYWKYGYLMALVDILNFIKKWEK
jgi:hypothetical protein